MPDSTDWKKILKAYMQLIDFCEGFSYLGDYEQHLLKKVIGLTDEEIGELKVAEKEAFPNA